MNSRINVLGHRMCGVAAVVSGLVSAAGNVQAADDSDRNALGLEEIVVTAQKRGEERLQDVPVPVTAINAEMLVDRNQLLLQDYLAHVPGFSIVPDVQSRNGLALRGITTGGATKPTIGVMVDDVPYGSSIGRYVPDIDPDGLARVEVLRGPQGTLYGAGSMGGLLKFVTLDPSTDAVSGRIQMGTSSVRNGDGPGYNIRGSINVPLTDTLAIRGNAFTRLDPGYIDNPVLGIDGVNAARYHGGRVIALWEPSEVLSLRLSALFQRAKGDGSSESTIVPGLTDLQQVFIAGHGVYEREAQAYSALLTAKLGRAEITSITGYSANEFYDALDWGGRGAGTFPCCAIFDERYSAEKVTQELRLSVPFGERIDWLIGGFFTKEQRPFKQYIWNTDAGGEKLAQVFAGDQFATYEEYAVLTNLTLQISERFDVQVGGRQSEIKQASGRGGAQGQGTQNAFTYLLTPRLTLSPDLMLYARAASGYRPGSARGNVSPTLATGCIARNIPCEVLPDKTQNYEIGAKGNAFDRALSFDASLYYIDWKDLQIQRFDSFSGYPANGSRARSRGVELSIESRPFPHTTLAAWIAWNDAEATEPLPISSTAFGLPGDRLPESSPWSGSFSVDQSFSFSHDLTGYVGASINYVDERKGVFTGTATRQEFPSYSKLDVRAGINYNMWTADFFMNNATDKRASIQGGAGYLYTYAFTYIQPRTMGLNLSYRF